MEGLYQEDEEDDEDLESNYSSDSEEDDRSIESTKAGVQFAPVDDIIPNKQDGNVKLS